MRPAYRGRQAWGESAAAMGAELCTNQCPPSWGPASVARHALALPCRHRLGGPRTLCLGSCTTCSARSSDAWWHTCARHQGSLQSCWTWPCSWCCSAHQPAHKLPETLYCLPPISQASRSWGAQHGLQHHLLGHFRVAVASLSQASEQPPASGSDRAEVAAEHAEPLNLQGLACLPMTVHAMRGQGAQWGVQCYHLHGLLLCSWLLSADSEGSLHGLTLS